MTKLRYRFIFPLNENLRPWNIPEKRQLVGHPNIFTLSIVTSHSFPVVTSHSLHVYTVHSLSIVNSHSLHQDTVHSLSIVTSHSLHVYAVQSLDSH